MLASLTLVLMSALTQGAVDQSLRPCLAPDFTLTDAMTMPPPTGEKVTPETLGERLTHMKVRCRKGKLVDSNGREVRLYRLIGCWGNPPLDYLERQAKQVRELRELRTEYTVVEIPCGRVPLGSRP